MTKPTRPADLDADEPALFDLVQRLSAPLIERAGACPAPQRVLAAYVGSLADAESRPLLTHLAACPMCQVLVEAIAEPALAEPDLAVTRRLDARIGATLAAASARARVVPFPARRRVAGVAALLATAATLILIVEGNGGVDRASLPAVMAPTRPGFVARIPGSILQAERLRTSDMGLASLSWRGDVGPVLPASAFDAPRGAFDRGEFAEAERLLAPIVERTPAFADAWLLLGVSRLHLRRPGDAIGALARAQAGLVGVARGDATWHLAVALHTTGRNAEARAVLARLCGERTERAAMACRAIDELVGP